MVGEREGAGRKGDGKGGRRREGVPIEMKAP